MRALVPIILGTILEYYDYALYGFCANIVAELFFPHQAIVDSLLGVFGIFLAGAMAKPIGAIFFGTLADRYPHETLLSLSFVGITLATMGIACLPTYATIGLWAPLGLLLCRFVQGACTAAGSDAVRVFLYEIVDKRYACFINTLSGASCLLGITIASMVAARLVSVDTYRLAFLIGGILGLFLWLTRHWLPKGRVKKPKKIPYKYLFKENYPSIISAILLCGSVGGVYHFSFVFLPQYLGSVLTVAPLSSIASWNAKAILWYTLFSPIAGFIADRLGPTRVLQWSGVGLFGIIVVNTMLISQGILSQGVWMSIAIGLAFFQAPGFVVLLERFKPDERYRLLSLGHSLGSVLLSGSAPVISLWLAKVTDYSLVPIGYGILLMGFGLIAVWRCAPRRAALSMVLPNPQYSVRQ